MTSIFHLQAVVTKTNHIAFCLGAVKQASNADEDELNKLKGLNTYLDAVAEDLKSRNFDVRRNRIPVPEIGRQNLPLFL